MGNYTQKLLDLHVKLEQIAKEENKTKSTVFKDFNDIFEDKLAIELSLDHKKMSGAEVQRKHNVTPKIFKKLILKTGFKPREHRKLKPFIYEATQSMNITHQEYKKIAKYLERKELSKELVVQKLIELRKK